MKKMALTQVAITLTAVVLYVINIWLRASRGVAVDSRMGVPLLPSIIGVARICLSGCLGGQIVHVYGVGVEARG